MRGLNGKGVLVAGGATGIGAATVSRLAEEGANVVIGDRRLDVAEASAERISGATGAKVSAVGFDATDESSVATLVAEASARLGRLDALHYNVANLSEAVFEQDTDVVDIDLVVWEQTLAANLTGFVHTLRHAVPVLLAADSPAIVATSSDASFAGDAAKPAYAVSKAGINALVRHTASKWGKQGLRCNAVAPSLTLTEVALAENRPGWKEAVLERVRSTRLGDPADTAAMVAYLMSDDGIWINGQVIGVNGGMYFR
ncbi:SDR family NAD(P)-dependent oxidoreductase [Streptomyces sp. NPDC055105]|uniref:SDR family NAD(P)-dependent oxidoreductase n=1 Tax=Streptomyces sp. NPDC055105 TaxID=3365719 RepID=UPI0037D19DD7